MRFFCNFLVPQGFLHMIWPLFAAGSGCLTFGLFYGLKHLLCYHKSFFSCFPDSIRNPLQQYDLFQFKQIPLLFPYFLRISFICLAEIVFYCFSPFPHPNKVPRKPFCSRLSLQKAPSIGSLIVKWNRLILLISIGMFYNPIDPPPAHTTATTPT